MLILLAILLTASWCRHSKVNARVWVRPAAHAAAYQTLSMLQSTLLGQQSSICPLMQTLLRLRMRHRPRLNMDASLHALAHAPNLLQTKVAELRATSSLILSRVLVCMVVIMQARAQIIWRVSNRFAFRSATMSRSCMLLLVVAIAAAAGSVSARSDAILQRPSQIVAPQQNSIVNEVVSALQARFLYVCMMFSFLLEVGPNRLVFAARWPLTRAHSSICSGSTGPPARRQLSCPSTWAASRG